MTEPLSQHIRNSAQASTAPPADGLHRADAPPYPDASDDTGMAPDRESPPSTPRWVKAFGIGAIVLVLLFAGLHLTGNAPVAYAGLQRPRARHASAVIMTPGVRKFALTVHLTCSVGWIGAVVAYLALGVAAVTSPDTQTVRAAWTGMDVTGWWVIVPLAIAALLTGFVMSLGHPLGPVPALLGADLARADHAVHRRPGVAHADRERHGQAGADCGRSRSPGTRRRPLPPRGRPAGVARDHRAQCVQASGRHPVRVA